MKYCIMESKKKKPKIKVTQNGPYFISGKINLQELIVKVDSKQIPVEWKKGKTYPIQEFYSLCRCGKSKNKPFCDSSHYPEAENVEAIHKR